MRILVVEDDHDLAANLKASLGRAGFVVDLADRGDEALFYGETETYDAIVLDLGLPDVSGLDVLRQWREHGIGTPVLILTARDSWQEKVAGFREGADDYLTKPYHPEELKVRLESLIRRAHGITNHRIEAGGFTLDEQRQSVISQERSISLSGTEYRILRYLMLHQGQIVSMPNLKEHVYGLDDDSSDNVIEVYISRLRKKLGKTVIETRRGQGYIFLP